VTMQMTESISLKQRLCAESVGAGSVKGAD